MCVNFFHASDVNLIFSSAACDGHTTLAPDGELPSQHRGIVSRLVAPHKDLNRSLQMKKKRVGDTTV